MRDVLRKHTIDNDRWIEEDTLFYTIVQTSSGFLAVVLAVDEGQLVYDTCMLFPTPQQAESDLLQRMEDETGKRDGFTYIAPALLFSRVMTLLVRREYALDEIPKTG